MTRDKLIELLERDYADVVKALSKKPKPKTEDPLKEYEVSEHPITSTSTRPDVPIVNNEGERVGTRKVNRIALAFEKLIVGRASAFLCANPIIYKAAPETPAEDKMWAAFLRVNDNTKLDYKNQGILEKRMSETEVAEIWYYEDIEPDDPYWAGIDLKATQVPKVFIVAPSLKDTLYPVWNEQESMIGLARSYKAPSEEDENKEVDKFDIYTADKIYEGVQNGAAGWLVIEQDNLTGKVMAIYHSQPDVEWAAVRPEMRRLEDQHSNLADNNDKVASPILYIEGKVDKMPSGPTGRVIQGPTGSKAYYVTSDNAPESTRMEIEFLLRYIYTFTDTVEITPETVKGLGVLSGTALELLFMPAHLKASKHAGTFGECLQRRINLIKKMLIVIDPSLSEGMSLNITPTFDFFLPKDVAGVINYLSTASNGEKILSAETAVNILQGLIGGDGKDEFDRLLNERPKTDDLLRDALDEAI